MHVYSICSSENLIEHNRNRLFFQGAKSSHFKMMSPTVENIMNCMTLETCLMSEVYKPKQVYKVCSCLGCCLFVF